MIYASLNYKGDYLSQHRLIYRILTSNFTNVVEGLQGDSYIWIEEDGQKVSVDSFTSMKHDVKGKGTDNGLAGRVIEVLKKSYKLTVFVSPEAEAHE